MKKQLSGLNFTMFAHKWIGSPIGKVITAIILIAVGIFLLISGLSFIGVVLALIAVILGIFLGGIGQLIGAIVVTGVLQVVQGDLINVLKIWTSNPKVFNTITFFYELGFIKSILLIFFITYTVSFLTGSVKLLKVSNSNSNENKAKEEK